MTNQQLRPLLARATRTLHENDWIPPLLVRLFVGYFFFETGWAKIHHLDGFTERFTEWGIPFPWFSARLSAYTEFIGGGLTVLGLGTRLVSIPMIINMIVAVITVKMKSVTGLDEFVELDEPVYALCFLWLMFSGAGVVSLDYVLGAMLGFGDRASGQKSAELRDDPIGKLLT